MDNDNFNEVPSNISTLIDLLEDKGISWGEYQEDMPYSGFEGYSWINQKTGANDYVRKHNPAILYNSVTENAERLSQIKNTTMFYKDLAANRLPQWMFITPNMSKFRSFCLLLVRLIGFFKASDGHDTSITTAGAWTRGFVEPLLTNKNFMQNTLVLITFDETETYTEPNRVMGILLGDVIPSNLVGTTDSSFYDHYSEIATVEANWGLHTLGRWDVGANVLSVVAKKTGDKIRQWTTPPFNSVFLNSSYPGLFNSEETNVPLPVPNTRAVINGRTVLPSIAQTWGNYQHNSYYTTGVEIPDGSHPPVYPS